MKPNYDAAKAAFLSIHGENFDGKPAKKKSGFARGSGCYTCNSCGKLTRATPGGDNAGCMLCINCYDLAGYENQISDHGIESLSAAEIESIRELLKVDAGRGSFDSLLTGLAVKPAEPAPLDGFQYQVAVSGPEMPFILPVVAPNSATARRLAKQHLKQSGYDVLLLTFSARRV